jgi:signal transduction protein with GAF and PtsI domain
MLSIERCSEILNKTKQKYTKEEVKAIRNHLYQFAEIIHQTKLLKDATGTTRKNGDPLQESEHH